MHPDTSALITTVQRAIDLLDRVDEYAELPSVPPARAELVNLMLDLLATRDRPFDQTR